MEAVLDLERLAERALLGAGAHHARRDAPRVARLDAHVVNLSAWLRDSVVWEIQEVNSPQNGFGKFFGQFKI